MWLPAKVLRLGNRWWGGRISLLLLLTVINLMIVNRSSAEELKRYEFLQIRMGIPVRIIVYADTSATANQASKAAYDKIREIDRCMSDYDPDSELMQFVENAEPGKAYSVSKDLTHVLRRSQQLSSETDGAFDVTVGPIVRLWRVARRRKELPDASRLEAALTRVGYRNLNISDNDEVTLGKSGMRIDLGGIAKGYAADAALAVLKEHGVARAMIDAGGDIVVGDSPPDRDGWRIEVEPYGRRQVNQQEETSAPVMILELANAAVATSGDTYQYIEIDGQRFSHLVNPKTGLGLTTPSSVTVIAPDGTTADSLASAVSVLGPKKGLQFIENKCGCALYMVTLEGDQRTTVQSKDFSTYVIAND